MMAENSGVKNVARQKSERQKMRMNAQWRIHAFKINFLPLIFTEWNLPPPPVC